MNTDKDECNFNLEQTVDHMSQRLWIGITCGLAMGASNATLRGMPIAKTSLSMGASCALAGTACLALERMVFHLYANAKSKILLSADGKDNEKALASSSLDKVQLGVSHALGGMGGGAISGGLFQGKPIAGAVYFMPLMCGVAFLEVKWHEYRMEQLRLLLLQEGQGQEGEEEEEEER
jgi:hypothetical protein